jgi:hypothetical protein
MLVNKEKKNYGKVTEIPVTRISGPANGAKLIFESIIK